MQLAHCGKKTPAAPKARFLSLLTAALILCLFFALTGSARAEGGVLCLTLTADGQPLSGALFDLYRDGQLQTKDLTTDSAGQITVKDLTPGVYYFQETQAPGGYVLPEDNKAKTEEVTVLSDQQAQQFNVSLENQRQMAKLRITKTWLGDAIGDKVKAGLRIRVTGKNIGGEGQNETILEYADLPYESPDLPVNETYTVAEINAATLNYHYALDTTESITRMENVPITADGAAVALQNYYKREYASVTVKQQWKGGYDDGTDVSKALKLFTVGADGALTPVKNASFVKKGNAYTVSQLDKFDGSGRQIRYAVQLEAPDGIRVTYADGNYALDGQTIIGAAWPQFAVEKRAMDTNKALAGAVYTLYSDSACASVYAALGATNENGISSLGGMRYGAYYLKETAAPENYSISKYTYAVLYAPHGDQAETAAVYTDAACTKKIASFSINSSGIGQAEIGVSGRGQRFYVKRASAPAEEAIKLEMTSKALAANDNTLYLLYNGGVVKDYRTVNVEFRVEKTVDGENAAQATFEFALKPVADAPMPGDRDVSSASIVYPSRSLGASFGATEIGNPGVYRYTVTEKKGDVPSYVYDTAMRIIKVEVIDEDGQLKAIATGNLDGVSYDNTGDPQTVTTRFTGVYETTDFDVDIQWVGKDGGPVSLTLYRQENNRMVAVNPQPAPTRAGNHYAYRGLPMLDERGKEITYAVTQQYIEGYMTRYRNVDSHRNATDYAYDGATIINTVATEFHVKVEWQGIADTAKRPDITLTLYRDGKATDKKPTADKNGWYHFYNLDSGHAFYVVEEKVRNFSIRYKNSGVNSNVTDKAMDYGIIINYIAPATGDSAPLWLWIAMVCVSAAGLTTLLLINRKKRRHRQ